MARARPKKPALGMTLHSAGVTYQHKLIRCGKPTCRRWHGPYWYAFWTKNGKTSSRYVGKHLPAYVEIAADGDRQLGKVAREVLESSQAAASRARRREKVAAENRSRRTTASSLSGRARG